MRNDRMTRGGLCESGPAAASGVLFAGLLLCLCLFAPGTVRAHGDAVWAADVAADAKAVMTVSIDFDPPNGVRRADPAMYTSFDAYVVLEGGNPANLPGGLRTVTLRLGVTGETSSSPQFESLLPKKLVMGGWREGIMLASAPCTAGDPIVIGVMHLFYLGKPGVVSVLDHPDFPRWVVDCEDEARTFEIGSHGGIHRDPPPVEHTGGFPVEADARVSEEVHDDCPSAGE